MSSKCIVIVFRNWQKNLLRWTMLCLFLVYFNLSHTILQNKIADISGIRTRIVKMKGQHGDHLTTITTILKMAEYRYLIWIILQEAHYPLTLFMEWEIVESRVIRFGPFGLTVESFVHFETVWQDFGHLKQCGKILSLLWQIVYANGNFWCWKWSNILQIIQQSGHTGVTI